MKERIDQLLRAAFELKASDIHLTVGSSPVFRIHGDLKRYGQEILKPHDTEQMAKAVIPEELWDEFKENGELDFSLRRYSFKYLPLGCQRRFDASCTERMAAL